MIYDYWEGASKEGGDSFAVAYEEQGSVFNFTFTRVDERSL